MISTLPSTTLAPNSWIRTDRMGGGDTIPGVQCNVEYLREAVVALIPGTSTDCAQ